MKRLTQIFQALLGAAALILTALIATGRLAWRTIRNRQKKRSKWFRRSIATILILFPIGIITLIAVASYDKKHGRSYWRDKELSKDVVAHSYRDNRFRIFDKKSNKYTTSKIYWVADANNNDSLTVYALPHKRGYINVKTGEIVIDAQSNNYSKAWIFSEGVAAVMKDGKIGFINTDNEVVIPFIFDYPKRPYSDIHNYLFHNGYCMMTDKEGKCGLIDAAGNWVVEPIYDEVWVPQDNGLRVVVKNGKRGLLDTSAKVIYPTEYDKIQIAGNNAGIVLAKDGRMWQVDNEGNVINPFMFDSSMWLSYPMEYTECNDILYTFSIYAKYEVNNCYGIMNRLTGKPITPAIYSDISMLSAEVFEVQEAYTGDYYLVDSKGKNINSSSF